MQKSPVLATTSIKIAILIELVILCGPAAMLLVLGYIFLPVAIMSLSRDIEFLYHIALSTLGLIGFITLINLTFHIIFNVQWWPGRPIQWAGIISGIAALIIGLVFLGNNKLIAFSLITPVIFIAHLLYLSKKNYISPT
jgi:hypothetical protein